MKLKDITVIEIDNVKYASKNIYALRAFLNETYPTFYLSIKNQLVKNSYIEVINYLVDRGHKVETY